MESEGRLAGGFRAEYLDDAAAGHASDAEGGIEADGAGRDGVDVHFRLVAELHDGIVAEFAPDGVEGILYAFSRCLLGFVARRGLFFILFGGVLFLFVADLGFDLFFLLYGHSILCV